MWCQNNGGANHKVTLNGLLKLKLLQKYFLISHSTSNEIRWRCKQKLNVKIETYHITLSKITRSVYPKCKTPNLDHCTVIFHEIFWWLIRLLRNWECKQRTAKVINLRQKIAKIKRFFFNLNHNKKKDYKMSVCVHACNHKRNSWCTIWCKEAKKSLLFWKLKRNWPRYSKRYIKRTAGIASKQRKISEFLVPLEYWISHGFWPLFAFSHVTQDFRQLQKNPNHG